MSIQVLKPGLLTTIQDQGRAGYQRFGVVTSGTMDVVAMRVANLLVGNDEYAPVLEMTLVGPKLRFQKDTLLAITGGDLTAKVYGRSLPLNRPVYLKADTVVEWFGCRDGCRAYVAVAGGFAGTEVLGSKSTYLRGSWGGHHGRNLKAGDQITYQNSGRLSNQFKDSLSRRMNDTNTIHRNIELHTDHNANSPAWFAPDWRVGSVITNLYSRRSRVRIISGTHFTDFTIESQRNLVNQSFRITPQSDRMGYRLKGAQLTLSEPLELLSEAVVHGTIQVPPEGNPIILLSDRQTTGGYPRIGQVITVDLPLLAQAKPGEEIMFKLVDHREAERLLIKREDALLELQQGIRMAMAQL
ncbi:5-oxoprolinase subunit C family protein [Brevibacillus daliensis]|uniref:5-oxoprolinase subunit C family protein n=1 Tax=Brevibacillus daliensis TaxID=2892995 RepID=UPI001E353150|nr:biotin-dependent carboxyltransferase family protein [Brevibacillus daliensis]